MRRDVSAGSIRGEALSAGVVARASSRVARTHDAVVLGGGHVVAEGRTAEELIDAIGDAVVHVIVVGAAEEPTVPEALPVLRAALPAVPVVVVAPGGDQRRLRRVLRAGACGLVREEDMARTLVPTLLAVTAGQVAVPAVDRAAVVRPVVSYRERQVLDLAARGFTNGQIARELYVSENTVKSHLSSGFRKLGVTSRSEAAVLVRDPELRRELGLADPRVDDDWVPAL